MSNKYKLKTDTLGPDSQDLKELKILNKILRIHQRGVKVEADPRHAELVAEDLGLESCKKVVTPGIKVSVEKDGDEFLNAEAAKRYRRLAARGMANP